MSDYKLWCVARMFLKIKSTSLMACRDVFFVVKNRAGRESVLRLQAS